MSVVYTQYALFNSTKIDWLSKFDSSTMSGRLQWWAQNATNNSAPLWETVYTNVAFRALFATTLTATIVATSVVIALF